MKVIHLDELRTRRIDMYACMPPVGTLFCDFATYPEMVQLMKNKPYVLPHEIPKLSMTLQRYIGTKLQYVQMNEWLVYGEIGQLKKESTYSMCNNYTLRVGVGAVLEKAFTFDNIKQNHNKKIYTINTEDITGLNNTFTKYSYIIDWIPVTSNKKIYNNIDVILHEFDTEKYKQQGIFRVNFNKQISGLGDLEISYGFSSDLYRGLQAYRLFDMRITKLREIISDNPADYGITKDINIKGTGSYMITPFKNVEHMSRSNLYTKNRLLAEVYKEMYSVLNSKNKIILADDKIRYFDSIVSLDKSGEKIKISSNRIDKEMTYENVDEAVEFIRLINKETEHEYSNAIYSPVVTPNLAYAIKMYTTGNVEGSDICSEINRKIKNNEKLELDEFIILRELVSFIDKSRVNKQLTLFRGCKKSKDNRLALRSTTFDIDTGYDFASKYTENGIIEKITLETDSKAALLSGLSWKSEEAEVLLNINIGLNPKNTLFKYDCLGDEGSNHRYIDVVDTEIYEQQNLKGIGVYNFIDRIGNYVTSEIASSRIGRLLLPDNRFKKHQVYQPLQCEKIVNELVMDYTDSVKLVVTTLNIGDNKYKIVLTLLDTSKIADNKKQQALHVYNIDDSTGLLSNSVDMMLLMYNNINENCKITNKLEYKARELYTLLLSEVRAMGATITKHELHRGTHIIYKESDEYIENYRERYRGTWGIYPTHIERKIDNEIPAYIIKLNILDINSVERTLKIDVYNQHKYTLNYTAYIDSKCINSGILTNQDVKKVLNKVFNHISLDLRDMLENIKTYIQDYERYVGLKNRKVLTIQKIKSDYMSAIYKFNNLIFEQTYQHLTIKKVERDKLFGKRETIIKETNYLDGLIDSLGIIYKNVV